MTGLKSILSDSNYEAMSVLWTKLTCDEKDLKEVRSLHTVSLPSGTDEETLVLNRSRTWSWATLMTTTNRTSLCAF